MEIPATSVSRRSLKRTTRGTIAISEWKSSSRAAVKVCSNLRYCHEAGIFDDSMLLSDHSRSPRKVIHFRDRHYSIVCPNTLSIARLFFLEDRPLLTIPHSTGNHPGKRQPACPGLPLVSFVLNEAGCLRTKLRVSSQTRLHSTSASLPKRHATTFHKASTMTVAQTVSSERIRP
jgi:hypothetical protein